MLTLVSKGLYKSLSTTTKKLYYRCIVQPDMMYFIIPYKAKRYIPAEYISKMGKQASRKI